MKNTELPVHGQICKWCNKNVFICETTSGGDYTTCPICSKDCLCSVNNVNGKCPLSIEDGQHEETNEVHFCGDCKIIYQLGCIHRSLGHNESVYYGKLVSKYKTDKDITYDGMPIFDSIEECHNLINKLELTWMCMCLNCEECLCPACTNTDPVTLAYSDLKFPPNEIYPNELGPDGIYKPQTTNGFKYTKPCCKYNKHLYVKI